jgi:DNA-binding CsgD family transcriptional regulator
VAALAARDAERLLGFVAAAAEVAGDDPFTPEVLVELGKLVPADCVTYCEQDRVRKRVRLTVGRAHDWDDIDEPSLSYWEIAHEHPVCREHNKGVFDALKISDFMTLRELRRSHVYDVWFRPIEHELNVALPAPPWHTKTFLFDRVRGDFTERDRLVLNLLQPHFVALWRAADTRRRLQAALVSLDWSKDDGPRGVVLLTADGRIDHASPAGRRLLREHFGAPEDAPDLPAAVARWLDSATPQLVRRNGDRRVTVSRSGRAVLLEETRNDLGLTSREQQILSWVARGKTNAEVAEILWISPSTVRKHLYNVYPKLGVRTRTAASTVFLGVLDGAPRDRTAST